MGLKFSSEEDTEAIRRRQQDETLRRQQAEDVQRIQQAQESRRREQAEVQRRQQAELLRQQQAELLRRQQADERQISQQAEDLRRRQQAEELQRRQNENQRRREQAEAERRQQAELLRQQQAELLRRQQAEERQISQQAEDLRRRQQAEELQRRQNENQRRREQAEVQRREQAEAERRQQAELLRQQQAELLRRQQAEERQISQQAEDLRRRQQAEELQRRQNENQRRREQAEVQRREQAEAERRQQAELLRRQQAEELQRRQHENQRRREAEEARRRDEIEERSILLHEKLLLSIDLYIRTRNRFDSRNPSAYQCGYSSIRQEEAIILGLNQLNSVNAEQGYDTDDLLEDIILESDQFSTRTVGQNYFISVSTLTPCQRRKHYVYGYFKCGGCQCSWESADSWMNDSQKCPRCQADIYPFKQEELDVPLNKFKKELALAIDQYLRLRRGFSPVHPLRYQCKVNSIAADSDVLELFNDLNRHTEITLLNFIRSQHRFISDDNSNVKLTYLTPFRGEESHRLYGSFKCGNASCRRSWESASTWTNKWQKCKNCETLNYPYAQKCLDQDDDREEDSDETRRPHDMERCQRCRELGRLCVPSMYYSA